MTHHTVPDEVRGLTAVCIAPVGFPPQPLLTVWDVRFRVLVDQTYSELRLKV